ncbi:MAG: ABC transporter permease [Ferruginibacter sp.]|nr:ABC transporter permease [Ferruginibacter sp.]
MQKNKLHTGINVIGMAVAFTCSILIFLTVYFMFSFDNFHENKDRLFKVYNYLKGPEGDELGTGMPYPARSALLTENIGVEKATLIRDAGNGVLYKDKELELGVKLVDADFLPMFSFPVIRGNKASALGNTGDVVLSENAAAMIFNTEDPIGKSIRVKISNSWKELVVSAVAKDCPPNSSLKFDLLARTELNGSYPLDKNNWNFQHSDLFVMLAKNSSKKLVEGKMRHLLKKYQPADPVIMKKEGFSPDENGDYTSLRLFPLTGLHFNPKLSNGGGVNKAAIYIVLLIGILILLIACFNFVNLNIGLSFNRSKEIGIRKCLGAGRRQVWLQAFGESFFVCLLALITGLIGAGLLVKLMNTAFASPIRISMLFNPFFLLILAGSLIAVAFIAGGYPSAIVSGLRTTEILKGKFNMKKSGLLRNGLVVAQFVVAATLICATIVIYQQFLYLRNAPLGYQTSSVISIPIRDASKGHEIVARLRMRLADQTAVLSVSGTSANLGMGRDGASSKWEIGFGYKGGPVHTRMLAADYNILNTIGIKPLEGRDFSASFGTDTANAVIITESLAKQLAVKDVLGFSFYPDSSKPALRVIGVVPDFHLYSMHEKADALMITRSETEPLGYALVKIKTGNPRATMDMIKNNYEKVEPGVLFKGSFVDENIERWYREEKEMGRMFSVSALIAVILSGMGLFGIALISTRQRVKEIGVRKVLGASATGIAIMITKDFVRPVIIAVLIAIPIAWWAMSKWLQEFVYRIQIHWWIFFATAAAAISIAILTVSFQAIKAAMANPVKSLRTE